MALGATLLIAPGLEVLAAVLPHTTFRGTGGFLVVTQPGGPWELSSANTDRAARDYAAVLTADDAVLQRLAHAVGRSLEDTRDRLAASYAPGASTIFVRYDGRSRAAVAELFNALDQIARGSGRSGRRLDPSVVHPLGQVTVDARHEPLALFPGEPTLLAFLLGLVVSCLWERANPRVSRHRVQAASPHPVLSYGSHADLDRVAVRLCDGGARQVVVRPVSQAAELLVGPVSEALRQASTRLAAEGRLRGPLPALGTGPDATGDTLLLLGRDSDRLRDVEEAVGGARRHHRVLVLLASARA